MFPLRKYTLTKTEIQKIRPAPATAPLPARPSSQVEKERSGGGGVFLRRTLTFRGKNVDIAAKTTYTALLEHLGRVPQLG